MSAPQRVTVVFSLLLLGCVVTSVLLLRHLDQIRTGATLEEVLYVSSPQALKKMSLGYDGLLADIYWTRAVQYFGNKHHAGTGRYDLLAPLLEITTTLDPHLLAAYEYGSNFLAPKPPNGGGMPERAIKLEEFGIQNNPNDWHLYYNDGFIHYMELKDYAGAADAFARGSRVPNAHPFLAILAAKMAEHAGDQQMARMMWSTTYQTTKDKSVRANAAAHLRALQVDGDVTTLEALTGRYQQQTGHFPSSFSEMEAVGLLRGTPIDPLGHPYKLMPDGRVEVQVPDDLPFIQKGTPPGYVPPLAPKFLPTD
ncbi:MAG: tetratricopeptide repeat protein [Terriglobales bacterium]